MTRERIEPTEDAGAGAPATAAAEPILEIDEVQGNVLVGFNKPHQAFLFLRITDANVFRGWLAGVVDHVATTAEVLAFKRLWKAMRRRRGGTRPALETAWFNLGFTASGLAKLEVRVEQFADEAFREGLLQRSRLLGDPPSGPGSPAEWSVGSPGREPDVLLLFAADSPEGLEEETKRLAGGWENAGDILHGAELLHRDAGHILPGGREHFGFVDGISQPGIRGRLSEDPEDYLTPRRNPHDPNQGMPGQDLIWPGEFVFGYFSQSPTGPTGVPGPLSRVAMSSQSGLEAWARNGSFLAVRHLRQDVEGMESFVRATAREHGLDPSALAAKLVGRWRSGAPLRLAPHADDLCLAGDDCRVNAFGFAEQTGALAPVPPSPDVCPNERADLASDTKGLECPLGAHIRKMNPRDDLGRFDPPISPSGTRARRILRRGIPYTAPSGEVGLHFLAYQTSLTEQFEFLQRRWANVPERGDFSSSLPYQAGLDPVIGRDPDHPDMARPFRLRLAEHPDGLELSLPAWVTPKGGGYFFCPSVRALTDLAGS